MCGRKYVCTFAIRGCSHVCGAAVAAVCVLGGSPGNILAAHWPAGHHLQHHPLSLATVRALLSLGQMIFLSVQGKWGCGWELGRSCDDISPLKGPGVDGDWGRVLGTAYRDLDLCFLLFLSSGQPGATIMSL